MAEHTRPPRRSRPRPTRAPRVSPSASVRRAGKPTASRHRSRALVAAFTLVGLVGLGLFVFPTQTLISQWQQTSVANQRLEKINAATSKLKNDTKALRGDAELERIAREQYGLTRSGETQYVLVPQTPLELSPPTTVIASTTTAPKKSSR